MTDVAEVTVPQSALRTWSFSDIRLRSAIPPEAIKEHARKIPTEADYDLLVKGPTLVRKPDGTPLLKYLPGAFTPDEMMGHYEVLHELRKFETTNRGNASGTPSYPRFAGATRVESAPIRSAMIGAFEAAPPKLYCRLSAWSGKELEKYRSLFPLFQGIGAYFGQEVPERYQSQMEFIHKTHPDWVIEGTPFSTVTVNNNYPTGLHLDSGDLSAGFSTLAVLRRGSYSGGVLVMPEYRVGVDMQMGDLILMDAHGSWHANTQIYCGDCGHPVGPAAGDYSHEKAGCQVERISIVCYYREKLFTCSDAEREAIRASEWAERRADIAQEQTMSAFAQETVEAMVDEQGG